MRIPKLAIFGHAKSHFPDVYKAYTNKTVSYGTLSKLVHENVRKKYKHLVPHHTKKRHRTRRINFW